MTFKKRPYAQSGIIELEKLARQNRETDALIFAELRYRNTARAAKLHERLEAATDRSATPKAGGKAPTVVTTPTRAATAGRSAVSSKTSSDAPPIRQVMPVSPLAEPSHIANDPVNILEAWTALEVLSPASFSKPADLVRGDMRRIARFDRGLPWAEGAKGPPGKRLYFQIVLGSIVMPGAIDALLERFGDRRPERPEARGETPLAIVIVDREGRPIPDGCATISSFGWGLPKALSESPAALAQWAEEEDRVTEALHGRLCREGPDGKPLPLSQEAINGAYDWLVQMFGIDRKLIRPPSFAIRSFVPFRSSEPPEAILLNSFFLKDLAKARGLFKGYEKPQLLERYLGAKAPGERRDLLHDEDAIEDVLAPSTFPAGRWPGPWRHPLVLMQQAAVNLAMRGEDGEILAVNGPPGTGKTTLLRDVVAALVTARASAMARLDDPEQAFTASGERLKVGGGWIHLYRLDPRIKGFEMLIASSNNKAVENVSGELPALGAIAEDSTMRYFQPVADTLLGQPVWGAIAAVLGNAGNRSAFKDGFWWDEDNGLFAYFKAVDGREPEINLPDGRSRPPHIVAALDPPRTRREALNSWQERRQRFLTLEKRVTEILANAELLRLRGKHLPAIERAFEAVVAHGAERPGFLHRLFGLARYRAWKRVHSPLADTLLNASHRAQAEKDLPEGRLLKLARSPWLGFGAEKRAAAFKEKLDPLVAAWRKELRERSATAIDEAFFENGSGIIQRTAPWLTAEEHRDRDALFEAALDLHQAFIDAAAKPLRQNIGAALQVIDGKGLGSPAKDALIAELWSSLFLVVPAMSTTFASVSAMLGRLPHGTLGWLLVDEAGQAAPQQAVGALMRARRAIVVGDPIQVPPVVMLPDRLTGAICRSFDVDADRFAAPTASVQTLADDATPWFAEFPSRLGSRTVGVPLLVHRRCADPMFKIANKVA